MKTKLNVKIPIGSLTIPVNNIDTMPERPSPSASMYLYQIEDDKAQAESKTHRQNKITLSYKLKKISQSTYEKYGKRTNKQHSKF